MEFGLNGLVDEINSVLELIFGDEIPQSAYSLIGLILLFFIFIGCFILLLWAIAKALELWHEKIRPYFYSEEQRQRRDRRRRFAQHIEYEITRLNRLEEWKDFRFTELEAEVEAEGKRQIFSFIPFLTRTRTGLYLEPSLSKALEHSEERLILLEGEPGSGKSIALRHVAETMAHRAKMSRSLKSIIPIYINLKELNPSKNRQVDTGTIREFVLKSLTRINDRDIDEFLEEEFDLGLQQGNWLFLFDSFDEIPSVLSSTEADETIQSYSQAIADFLHGMNRCRGIIASRHFRGPSHLGWPRFRIRPLSYQRQINLIGKAGLKVSLAEQLQGELQQAPIEIKDMVTNPMFLGLLCEYMRTGNPFPTNTHAVFEDYIENRFKRDKERLDKRYNVDLNEVRIFAENIAFCMTADSEVGLSPTRAYLRIVMERQSFQVPDNFDILLDTLEYVKLARSEADISFSNEKIFTFAHMK